MAFRFRLEKVMKVRQRTVEQQSLRVAAAEQAIGRLEEGRKLLDRKIFQMIRSEISQAAVLNIQDLTARTQWLEYLHGQREDLAGQLDAARVHLAAEREKLGLAWRDLEVLKQLKKTQKSAWQEEIRTRENKELDEIGQIRADRQRRENISRGQEQTA